MYIDHLVRKGVKAVLTDDGFAVASPLALASRSVATAVATWCEDPGNEEKLQVFARGLIADLSVCLEGQPTWKPHIQREHMWHQYHKVHTTKLFTKKWVDFILLSTSEPASPVFYQYVTDIVFRELIQAHFPVVGRPAPQRSSVIITNEEANVIRYAAGYTLRTLRKRIEKGSHPLKEEVVLAIMELVADNEDEEHEASAEWVSLVDRGGLWHITNATFMFFCAIEEVLRSYLKVSAIKELSSGRKSNIIDAIVGDDVVAFYWCLACVEAEEEEKKELLFRIVDLWVTIRGFSFARSWMEMYKQANKKGTQRVKALRKELH